ncbi:4-hydroxy-2-oxovalerate aldolase [bacterium]|nr:4-hydroxy-2-oxovalerate aldolase [bacterium]MCG2711705.1 4-hydroxy-2-oxovalerate aldolase [Candidatus Omnitrophota bacterium]
MNEILFFDSTLRDGSHAVAHQLTVENIRDYCAEIDSAGVYTVIVGHGNGLGASSLQVGLSGLTDHQMLTTARSQLKKTRLGVFLIPGFGTIKDDLAPALEIGVDLVCVAAHCTEADVTRQHIEYVRSKGKEAFGILMMQHMTTKERLLEEALKMQEYGALGVILMDSAGASLPDLVTENIGRLVKGTNVKVGFHAHNNLGMAIANSFAAIKAGAMIIDGTLRGFGAGAGNCQMEVLAGCLNKAGIETELDLYKLMDVSEHIATTMMTKAQEITSIGLISGLAGVFSGFATKVKVAAERFGVDPRDIFMELGKRKVVAGQEDFITDVAIELAEQKNEKAKNQDLSF